MVNVNVKNLFNLVSGLIEMNNQEVIEIAKVCGLIYNNNHDILDFYQRIRKELKKEFTNKSQIATTK